MSTSQPNPYTFAASPEEIAARIQAMLDDQYTWRDRAYDLLRTMLQGGWLAREGELAKLIDEAYGNGGDEQVEELLYRLEVATTSTKVYRNERHETATLLTVPLAMIPDDISVEVALGRRQSELATAIEKVAAELKTRGLVRQEAELVAIPRLYTADEVSALSYADVAALLDSGIGLAGGKPVGTLPVPENTSSVFGDSERQLANPVFLVLAHIDDEQYVPFDQGNSSGMPRQAFQDAYWSWAFDSVGLLEDALGQDVFVEMSALPLTFFEGFRVGVEGARGLELLALVAAQIDARGIAREDVAAQFLDVTEEEAQLIFRNVESGATVGSAVLPVFDWETPEVAQDNIETLLYDLGLAWPGVIPADVSGPRASIQGG